MVHNSATLLFYNGFGALEAKKADTMKKLMSIVMLLAVTTALHAQKSVTQFLGIPVDGTKSEMIRKLKAKGFESNPYNKEVLEGEFNGYDVRVHVVTNNNKVSRIMVEDAYPVNETSIRIRFNTLCNQFKNNGKYVSYTDPSNYLISENENIGYNTTVNHKRYEAVFYQIPEKIDTIAAQNELRSLLLEKYSAEQLENPTEEIKKEFEKTAFTYASDMILKSPVWFMIDDEYGEYRILMYYDNEYNRADGSDL